jgi:hypothetical protein
MSKAMSFGSMKRLVIGCSWRLLFLLPAFAFGIGSALKNALDLVTGDGSRRDGVDANIELPWLTRQCFSEANQPPCQCNRRCGLG